MQHYSAHHFSAGVFSDILASLMRTQLQTVGALVLVHAALQPQHLSGVSRYVDVHTRARHSSSHMCHLRGRRKTTFS